MNKELLEEHIKNGHSSHEIAEQEQKGQSTVMYWLKKYSLKTNHGHGRAEPIIENGLAYSLCLGCKEKKESNSDNFYIRPDGSLHHWCRSCHNKKTAERQRNCKLSAIKYKGGKCEKCGYDKFYGALEFHHLDSTKKEFAISESNRSFENLKKELDKCSLLCSNCHKETHALAS